ncbi:hypothetical protein RUM43_011141 [Polyplax serrata]|uniref:Probable arginine--tRNA ligase, mitochondrial n=1 Tax=Polyplax serrata TaxID=468196 RepID=A0AAN8NLM3_POLSC
MALASKLKHILAKNFYDAVRSKSNNIEFVDVLRRFYIKCKQKSPEGIYWAINVSNNKVGDLEVELFKSCQQDLLKNNLITDINFIQEDRQSHIEVQVPIKNFIKETLDSNPLNLNYKPTCKKILVDYSSPNIAKPFHVGHLRSTLIGNYLANLKKRLGNNVYRINYLGDWGTQIGVLQIGIEAEKYTTEDLRKDPLQLLFKAYVKGNRIVFEDDDAYKKARQIFSKMESGDENILKEWQQYKEWSVEELKQLYSRLGVVFDEFVWESDYNRTNADTLLNILEEKNLLSVDENSRKVVTIGNKKIPLIKSDNSTLYLTRDLMALCDRKEKHKFDELYYVVENGQSEHFHNLFTISDALDLRKDAKVEHVKFGRIQGMSTRKGKVVFLRDVLEEAKERAYMKQIESKTTKVPTDTKDIADIVGICSVIVNDLKHQRKLDYKMSWEDILQLSGNTGGALQYCNCRLNSIKVVNNRYSPATECDPEALLEPEAIDLVREIGKYESVLLRSENDIEASLLTRYLFDLMKATNTAIKALNIKKVDEHLARQRLLLFDRSKAILEDGLKLMGITPLSQM